MAAATAPATSSQAPFAELQVKVFNAEIPSSSPDVVYIDPDLHAQFSTKEAGKPVWIQVVNVAYRALPAPTDRQNFSTGSIFLTSSQHQHLLPFLGQEQKVIVSHIDSDAIPVADVIKVSVKFFPSTSNSKPNDQIPPPCYMREQLEKRVKREFKGGLQGNNIVALSSTCNVLDGEGTFVCEVQSIDPHSPPPHMIVARVTNATKVQFSSITGCHVAEDYWQDGPEVFTYWNISLQDETPSSKDPLLIDEALLRDKIFWAIQSNKPQQYYYVGQTWQIAMGGEVLVATIDRFSFKKGHAEEAIKAEYAVRPQQFRKDNCRFNITEENASALILHPPSDLYHASLATFVICSIQPTTSLHTSRIVDISTLSKAFEGKKFLVGKRWHIRCLDPPVLVQVEALSAQLPLSMEQEESALWQISSRTQTTFRVAGECNLEGYTLIDSAAKLEVNKVHMKVECSPNKEEMSRQTRRKGEDFQDEKSIVMNPRDAAAFDEFIKKELQKKLHEKRDEKLWEGKNIEVGISRF